MDVVMNSGIKMDILFAGLLLIPIVVSAVPYIQNNLVSYTKNMHSTAYALPISVYMIYNISVESNIAGIFCLFIGYSLFFFTYAVAISLLANATKNNKHG
tara:strand:+ start:568 stop:867 length:300 start_codon:yes stop_codon:yes gene_type:complete